MMQPMPAWMRVEPWAPTPGLMSAMGLGASGGAADASDGDGAWMAGQVSRGAGGDDLVSRGEWANSEVGDELVSRGQAGLENGDELVSREAPGAQGPGSEAAPAEHGGSEAMWREAIGERSTAVGRMACVQAPKGARLRPRPALGRATLGVLPFGEAVHVQRRTEHGWCWVVVVGSGAAGFVEQHFLAMDPPEPGARLLQVRPGDELHELVSRHYPVREGSDARLYVQAVVEANRGRRGVYLTEGELDFVESAVRGESAERTVRTYRGAKVRKGHAIWLPSEGFVAALRSMGAVTSGESIPSAAWRGAKAAAGAALDGARYAAAFTVGLLEGGFGAVADLFTGAAELVGAVAQIAMDLVTGDVAALVAMARGWASKLSKVWENRGAIAEDFLRKWEAEDAWARGSFQGEVLGWVMMTALLCLATAGAGALAAAGQLSGRWSAVLRALAALDALGDVTTYAGAVAQLPSKAVRHVRGRLGRSVVTPPAATRTAEGVDGPDVEGAAGELLDEPARANSRARSPEESYRVTRTSTFEVHARSDDGHDFFVDIRKVSPRARHVIRQLEKRGSVQLSEIPLADLPAISQWFGKEIAVMQTRYGKLRIVLGETDGILLSTLRTGDRFLVHTHPVAVSRKSDFAIDLQMAGKEIEAVVDWNGNIVFYDRVGLKNPVRRDGVVEAPKRVHAAFLDEQRNVRARATVRTSPAGRAIDLEVEP